jgi:type I restriction enzyme S subunit
MEEQIAFSTYVQETEETRTTIQRSLKKLETLKNALMQEYFG